MQDMNEKRYRLSEAAPLIGVSSVTLWRWCASGKIASIKLPSGQRRIPESELTRILQVEPVSIDKEPLPEE